jgi:leucyl-tRNA synthetase
LEEYGFRVIRFTNKEVLDDTRRVTDRIQAELAAEVLPFGEDVGGVSVFTTRADTLFGVTYIVLAPEHELVAKLSSQIANWPEVESFISKIKATSEDDRTNDKNEKTGIELKGITATNPANGEEVPVWIANYVLASYGTGAVMAVPAHDERDWEFAKKYELPIKEVVAALYEQTGENASRENVETIEKKVVVAIVENDKGEILVIHESSHGVTNFTFIGGGIEEGESEIDALKREITEESGCTDFEIIQKIPAAVFVNGYRHPKEKNQNSFAYAYYVKLKSENKVESEADQGKHALLWVKKDDVKKTLTWSHHTYVWQILLGEIKTFTGYGMLINSGQFNGLTSEEARTKITSFVGGTLVTKYKMRDAIFARQRYWGEPIPLRHDSEGIITPLDESQLPLVLPELADFAPAGDGSSPLAKSDEWMKAGYETNTMPGWAGSSWYFLRYMDPHNDSEFVSKNAAAYWGQVDMYVGGAEHATGHLLYSRFWNMALYDLGHVAHAEPFAALRNQGLIGGTDGRKMSKRWGNVINPDDVISQLGADTLRVYESFMGPFDAHLPWSTDGIVGSRRFIERVYRAYGKIGDTTDAAVVKVLHKTIKKVTDDIAEFKFNTAVSALMICVNEIEKASAITQKDFKLFLQLLAPFAPHITEELWYELGETSSIHLAQWPVADEALLVDDEVTIGVQINGKVRAELTIATSASKEDIESAARALPRVIEYTEGKTIRNVIVVPGRIINIITD